jgi:hypothetical protein
MLNLKSEQTHAEENNSALDKNAPPISWNEVIKRLEEQGITDGTEEKQMEDVSVTIEDRAPLDVSKEEDSLEEKAKKFGITPEQYKEYSSAWKPQKEFKGDPDDWRPLKVYIKNAKQRKSFENLQKENQEFKKALESIDKKMRQQEANIVKKTLDDLMSLRREAVAAGDLSKADEYSDAISENKKIISTSEPENKEKDIDAQTMRDYEAWTVKNAYWIDGKTEDHRLMRAYVRDFSAEYQNDHPERPQMDSIYAAEAALKANPHFKMHFDEPNYEGRRSLAERPSGVSTKKVIRLSELAPADQKTIRAMAKVLKKTPEEYLKDVIKSGLINV